MVNKPTSIAAVHEQPYHAAWVACLFNNFCEGVIKAEMFPV